MRKNYFEELMGAINSLQSEVAGIRADVDALKEGKTATSRKSAPKKATKTSAKQTATKTAKKQTAPKTEPKTSTKLADFEPCKFKDSDYYVWGGTRGYKAMRSAYCYAKQTKGQAKNLAEAKKLGFEIDFDKAWTKAKAEFEKKYVYVKAEDR